MVRVAEQPRPVPDADGADQQVPRQVAQHVEQLRTVMVRKEGVEYGGQGGWRWARTRMQLSRQGVYRALSVMHKEQRSKNSAADGVINSK